MTLQQLVYVKEIARCSSINKAAQNLYLSQSCISGALKSLEEELHIRIFSRTNRGVELTQEGKEFLGYAGAMLEQKDFIEGIYMENAVNRPVIFSVAVNHALLGIHAFLRLLEGFFSRPYNLKIKETGLMEAIDNVYNHEVDIAIVLINNLTEKIAEYVTESRGIEIHMIRETAPCAVIRAGHPLAQKETVQARDLNEYPYINYEHTHGQPDDVATEVKLLGMKRPSRIIRINDRAAWSTILANTDVIGFGNRLMKKDYIESGLVAIPVADNKNTSRLVWIRAQNQAMSPYADEFISIVKNFVEAL